MCRRLSTQPCSSGSRAARTVGPIRRGVRCLASRCRMCTWFGCAGGGDVIESAPVGERDETMHVSNAPAPAPAPVSRRQFLRRLDTTERPPIVHGAILTGDRHE